MKAKYKEKLRLILIDNKLSIEEKNAATDNVVEDRCRQVRRKPCASG
jgi:hypothetical protein